MHILIIASWYKKILDEVHAPFIEEQARMLLHTGFKVGVFHPYFIGGFKEKLKKNYKNSYHFIDNGLQTWYYGEMSFVPYFRNFIYTHLCRNADKVFLEYVHENGMPDILHAHSVFMGGVVANYLSKKYNIPYCITEHSSKLITDFDSLNKSDFKYIKTVLESSVKSIYVSLFQKQKMIRLYGLKKENQCVINNVLNPIFHFKLLDYRNSSFTIIITGGLIERKNHILLFKAIKALKSKGIECLVKVIGDGNCKKELESFVDLNLLNKNILFMGSLSRNNVYKELTNSHCLISVSKFETFGINLIEALGVGRTIISTNSGGPAEIVTKENGLLLNTYSVDELVDSIIYLKNNYRNYNLQQISAYCHDKYSEINISKQLLKLYTFVKKTHKNTIM